MAERNEAKATSVFVQLRRSKNLSQKQVADALGVSQQTVRNWEHGRTQPQMTIAQTRRLCELLEMSISDIPEWFGPVETAQN